MKSEHYINHRISYSHHSESRMSQRGISPEAINACLRFGEVIHKQSLKFFFITKKKLDLLPTNLQEKVKDLVVVMDLEMRCVITCYRNAHAAHRIKKKPKRLSVYLGRE